MLHRLSVIYRLEHGISPMGGKRLVQDCVVVDEDIFSRTKLWRVFVVSQRALQRLCQDLRREWF